MIKINKTRIGVKPYSFVARLAGTLALPLAAVAVGAAFTFSAQAAQRNRKGNGANTSWNTSGNWDTQPGSGDALQFRTTGIKNMTATINGTYSYNGNIHMGAGSSADNPYIFEAAASGNSLTVKDDTWFGYYEDGWLWIKSGTYTFNGNKDKHFHMGQGANNAVHNFWLKVGDGSSSVSVAAKGNVYIRGGSSLIADKATLNFSGKNYYMYNTSLASFNNASVSTAIFQLDNSTSVSFTNSTLTASGRFNMYGATSAYFKDTTATAVCLNQGVTGGETSTTVFDGGSLTISGDISAIGYHERTTGYMYATNLTLTTGTRTVNVGGRDVSCTNATGIVDKKGGDWTIGGNLVIGAQTNTVGVFTADGGSVTVGGSTLLANAFGATGTLTLKDETFTTRNIGVVATGRVFLDGSTLVASEAGTFIADGITVEVGTSGGTIDTAEHDIVIEPGVSNASGTTGALSITGAGMATLTGAIGCDAVLDAGTVLGVTDANKSLLANLTVAISDAGIGDGVLVLTNTTENGTFSAADVGAITLTGNQDSRYMLVLADGNTTIRFLDTLAGEYVWNDGASEADWTSAGKWSKGGVAGDWFNSTHAAFANSGDKATLDADVTAVDVTFRANAEVLAGGGTLTVPSVIVSNGVSATIAAPIAGALAKTGGGTLTLGANRTDDTVLSEGTLALSGMASLDWTKLTFGTDAEKPVTLRVGPNATLANIPSTWNVGNVANRNVTLVKEGGDWTANIIYLASGSGTTATLRQTGGTFTINGTFDLGKGATGSNFEIAGGTVTHNGYIHMGAGGTGTMTVTTGGRYEKPTKDDHDYGIIVGGNYAATLNVTGGDVFINGSVNMAFYGSKKPSGTVNITDSGVLACSRIVLNGGGGSGGTAVVSINGGTLRANEDNTAFFPNKNNLTVTAGSNGGTLDVNGRVITMARPIGGTGGMTFKGGGVATFTASNTYAGTTTVEVGTTVIIPAPSAIGGGLAVTVPETAPTDGVYALVSISGEGTFAASVLEGVAAPTGSRLVLSGDAKSVLCICGNPDAVWIGGASGNLSVGSNWTTGTVPTIGDSCVIGSATAANLVLGDTFAPASITFSTNSALVTISGERALSGLTSIVNNALQHHVLAFPIDASAATPTLPLLDANYLVFSGGITLSAMPSIDAMRLAGEWNLTGNWGSAPSGTSIMAGSTVNVSGTLANGYNIFIQTGATLRAAAVTGNQGETNKNRFLYRNNGAFIIAGNITESIQSTSTTAYSLAGFFAYSGDNAVTRANGLVHSGSTKDNHQFRLNNSSDSVTNTIVLGSGGLSFLDNRIKNNSCFPYFHIDSGKSVILASSADWALAANPVSGKDLSLELPGSVTIDTSDYDDRTVGHTVRSFGRIGNDGKVTVKGCGTLAFEYRSDFAGGLSVTETATVALKSGKVPTRAPISVANGATLKVAESGAVALQTNLTLADGAALAFNYTEKTPPVLNVTGRTVTFGSHSNIVVKVSATDGKRAKGGANVLTSGGKFAGANVMLAEGYPDWVKGVGVINGEIVLNVKPSGMIIIVK